MSHISHVRMFLTSMTYLTFDSASSGRRGSNPRPTAWKAVALPTELLPRYYIFKRTFDHLSLSFNGLRPPRINFGGLSGQGWIRTTELRRGQIYSLLPLATWLLALHLSQRRDSNPRPADYKSAALPTELLWQFFIMVKN